MTLSSALYVLFSISEKKLEKMKGASTKVKPKDMIKSLQSVRDQQITQFMTTETICESYFEESVDMESDSIVSSFQRKINPAKQAIDSVELLPLLREDFLAKTVETDQLNDGEQVT